MASHSDDWNRVKQLLAEALELGGKERTQFLDEQCGTDTGLRRELEELIGSSEETRGFLEEPAIPPEFTEDPALKAGDRVGPYEIVESLGEGGFAQVYGATQEVPIRRRVAVKVIKPGMDSRQIAQRFAAEREALSRMEHPHIARVLDAGQTEQGRPYVVMEWVEGLAFADYCDAHKLDIHERIELMLQACAAIEHAHQKGVVHRDIKPSNVLVEHRDGRHAVKVIDFGIAKALQSDQPDDPLMTQTGMILGTPEYMSPEQAGLSGGDIDTRADVYALGVLLYETLTGVRPFSRDRLQRATLDELIRMIREVDPPRPSTRREAATEHAAEVRQLRREDFTRALRGDLDWIVMRALEKDRENRYPSVGALADDLRRYLAHEPVSAGPPRALYRMRKFARRNRAVFAGLSIAVLAVLGGTTAAGIGFFQASAAREEERLARLATESALEEAESVSDFLADLLYSVRPDELGRDVKVRDLLDNAQLQDLESPIVEGRLRGVVGNAYRTLGVFDRAESELTAARDLSVREFGADDERTLGLEMNLLLVRMDASKEAGLVDAARALLERSREALGADAAMTLEIESSYGAALANRRQFGEGIPLLEQLLPRYERVIGPNVGSTLSLIGNLALAHSQNRDFTTAEKYARMHYERSQVGRPPDHPRVLFGARSLAMLLLQQQKWPEAMKVLDPLVEKMRRVYGDDHVHTLGVENYVGFVLQKSGRQEEAAKLYERIVPLQDQSLGKHHRQSMMAVHNLGMLFFDMGKRSDAEPLLRDALVRFTKQRGESHFETAANRFHLGQLLAEDERHEEALPFLTTALGHLVDRVTWKHPKTMEAGRVLVSTLDTLARNAYRAGDVRGATGFLAQAWETAGPLESIDRRPMARTLAGMFGELQDAAAAALWRGRAGK